MLHLPFLCHIPSRDLQCGHIRHPVWRERLWLSLQFLKKNIEKNVSQGRDDAKSNVTIYEISHDPQDPNSVYVDNSGIFLVKHIQNFVKFKIWRPLFVIWRPFKVSRPKEVLRTFRQQCKMLYNKKDKIWSQLFYTCKI